MVYFFNSFDASGVTGATLLAGGRPQSSALWGLRKDTSVDDVKGGAIYPSRFA